MRYEKIPLSDNVMRQISPQRLRKDGDGNIVGIFAEAFETKTTDGLSTTWVEFWNSDEYQRPFDARTATNNVRTSKNAKYACAKCGDIIAAGQKKGTAIRVLHDPVQGNEGHALVKMQPENPELCNAFALEVFELDQTLLK